jgi:N-acetylglucosamine-6-phosphate deacetylase
MQVITNAKIVLSDRILNGHDLVTDRGRITGIFPKGSFDCSGCTVTDAKGYYLGPGLVDIHNHGGAGEWFSDDPDRAASYHLAHGTTCIMATTTIQKTHEMMLRAIENITGAVKTGKGAASKVIRGIHMEGPYLSPKYGAFKNNARIPVKEEYLAYVKAAEGLIKIWTVAPELPGIKEMLKDLRPDQNDPLPVISAGHSEATTDQVNALIPYGLRLETHSCCATGCSISPSRYEGTREVDFDMACWLKDEISVEVIPDSKGIHTRPEMLQLILKIKGLDKVIIVTDATYASGRAGQISDVNITEEGLTGSALTLNKACANMMAHTRISIVDAFHMASYNPAKLIGMDKEIGSIESGKRSDLILVDDYMDIHGIWLNGEPVTLL